MVGRSADEAAVPGWAGETAFALTSASNVVVGAAAEVVAAVVDVLVVAVDFVVFVFVAAGSVVAS